MNKIKFRINALILIIFIYATPTLGALPEFYVEVDPDDFDRINNNFHEDIYVPCQFTHNGKTWQDVSMRVRGEGSRAFPKKPYKFKFDGEKFLDGNKKLNFNAEYEDETYMKNYLSSRLMNAAGIPCFVSQHARLYINGNYHGLYLITENMDEHFFEERDLDVNGTLFKATNQGACLSTWDIVTLHWEKKLKEDGDFSELQELIDSINAISDDEYYDFCRRWFDYDKLITIVTMNILLTNHSTYYHNYFMYHDVKGSGKWQYIPWDMDKTFSSYGYSVWYTMAPGRPDNPLYERSLNCKPMYEDIKAKAAELSSSIFSEEWLFPIMDSLALEIEQSVRDDNNDNIDYEQWTKEIHYDKEFVRHRYEYLRDKQFDKLMHSFKVIPTTDIFTGDVVLRWHPAITPDGSAVKYKVSYSDYIFMTPDRTTEVENIEDTIFVIPKGQLAVDDYYWTVEARNDDYYVEGVNNMNIFSYRHGTVLPEVIDEHTTLYKEDSPYVVNTDLIVPRSVVLTAEPGTEIRFGQASRLIVRGKLNFHGSAEEPIWLRPMPANDNWGHIHFDKSEYKTEMEYVFVDQAYMKSETSSFDIIDSKIIVDRDLKDTAVMKFYDSNVEFHNNYVKGTNTGEGLFFTYSTANVSGNTFISLPDAIEFVKNTNSSIINNVVLLCGDDAIDMNGCKNIEVAGNLLVSPNDKGISIGHDGFGASTNVTISRNVIVDAYVGIEVKGGSDPIVTNNTIYNCDIGLKCKMKLVNTDGGYPDVDNCILAGMRHSLIDIDEHSDPTIDYCLADIDGLPGDNNITGNPLFLAPDQNDFNISSGSPCIDAGNPNSPKDPDGTLTDIGAFYYNQANVNIVINEICYNPSDDQDTDDWVELFNPSEIDADLSGWIFKDEDDSHSFEIPDGTVLNSGAYLVLCSDLAKFEVYHPDLTNAIGDLGFGLSGGGELLRLYNKNGILIDDVEYDDSGDWPSEPDGSGPTLELNSPTLDNALGVNWHASRKSLGTPGQLNSKVISVLLADTQELSVFPNPANDYIMVNLPSDFNNTKDKIIRLYDIFGNCVISKKAGNSFSVRLDIDKLSAGIYIIRAGIYNRIVTVK